MESIETNVTGGYRVDDQCIGCFICAAIAPKNFKTNHEEGRDYVSKQPQSQEEERLCAEAMDVCPVSAIGNGDEEPALGKERECNR